MSGKGDECVKVVVRCRPANSKEKREGRKNIVTMNTEISEIVIDPTHGEDESKRKRFTYDAVYDENSTQRMVYDETAFPLVESVLDGFNGTIFAYGQTGCGKTWTMSGMDQPEELRGVIPNSFEHIFEYIKLAEASNDNVKREFLVRASFLEIYQEDIRDLLGTNHKQRMEVKESPEIGVYVKNLTFEVVENKAQIDKVLELGTKRRSVGETNMNEVSSRSHAIFGIVIEVNEVDDEGNNHLRAGKLNLVDLAGSERQSKTGASGGRLREGAKINLSLTALGNVISALIDSKGKHIPYRDSKLTRLLQDSLGGNTKTVMISAISPADYNYEETMSTLRYANRAKNIKNKPVINEDPKDALLRTYKEEIEQLKAMLEGKASGSPGDVVKEIVQVEKIVHVPVKDDELNKELSKREAEISRKVDEIEQERKMREELEEKLKQLQHKVLGKKKRKKKRSKRDRSNSISSKTSSNSAGERGDSDDDDDAELAIARQHREYRTRQYSLTASRKKEAARQYAARENEEELATMEGLIETKERAVKVLKQKLMVQAKRAENEIRDIEEEFQTERESLLNTIREQGRDITLLEQLVEVFLPPSEVSKVWEQANWDADRARWKIPRIRPRKDYAPISLPGLANARGGQGGEVVEEPSDSEFQHQAEESEYRERASSRTDSRSSGYSGSFDPMGARARIDSRDSSVRSRSAERRHSSSEERVNIHTTALSPMDHSKSEVQSFDRVNMSTPGAGQPKRQQAPRELAPITGVEDMSITTSLGGDDITDKFVNTSTRQPMTKISPLKRPSFG